MPTAILSVSNLVIHFSIIDLPFYSKAFVAWLYRQSSNYTRLLRSDQN
jgi:hypothetical protein